MSKRHNFSKRKLHPQLPNLLSIQHDSYNWLQKEGIQEILDELGTIEDVSGRGWILTLSDPKFDKENITLEEAIYKGRTYDASWYLTATITDPIANKQKQQQIYMGDLPVITKDGTFIINGVEKVVINQLRRAEGVLFSSEIHPSTGKNLAGVKILPKNGIWLELDTSKSGVISVKIDRKRKMPITVLLRIFGLESDDAIREAFKDVDTNPESSFVENTLAKDPSNSYDEAVLEVYKKVRPGEPLILENAKALVDLYFFNERRYSLGKVGRFKLNQVLGVDFPNDVSHQTLQQQDLIQIVKRVININNGVEGPTDVDHLSNRRVRSVGELLQDEVRIGFLRMEKNIKERMSLQPREELPEPSMLISARTVASSVHSFFATGQLSQHHDQQNPMQRLDHLRRLSVLGPQGLSRERASMAVRDVHYSSFGKICPVRTPEGPNVGLINYLATYASVNEYGFLQTPYRKIIEEKGKMKITNEVVSLAAYEEDNYFITDSSIQRDDKGYITQDQVPLRKGNDFSIGSVKNAQYVELVPQQVVGIAAGMIPYLANDDITRALMGTQQMSQAVPLIRSENPIVATGIENEVALNAGIVIIAEESGEVDYADAEKVIVKYKGDSKKHTYTPQKFVRSNNYTSINQKVNVKTGDKIKKGDVLIEGPACEDGDLALGTNLLTAYMIYEGYEFEDGVIISDRLVKDDKLTSVHIFTYRVPVLETKLGPEEITNDIPNVSEEVLRNLGEDGIVTVGSKVKSGDILVGKVAPKGEVELSAEERLLRAIFGEKAKEVRDNSLKLPHGKHGTVIGVKRVNRKQNNNLRTGVLEEITVYVAQRKKIEVGDKLSGRHGNKGVISAIIPQVDMPHLEDGTPIDIILSADGAIKRMNVGQLLEAPLGLAGSKLDKKYIIPNFEPLPQKEIDEELKAAGVPTSGRIPLIDGRTGEYFHDEVTVGLTYILKLTHMSEEKMHARSTGPYSLITQQPLGGKAQMGGQRLGEMEVWALEAYGAAHNLREMLTIKSDDWLGRTQAYKALLQGQPIPESNIPESFKLLVRELNGLSLGIAPLGGDDADDNDDDASDAKSDDTAEDSTSPDHEVQVSDTEVQEELNEEVLIEDEISEDSDLNLTESDSSQEE